MSKHQLKQQLEEAMRKDEQDCGKLLSQVLTSHDCKLAVFGKIDIDGTEHLVPIADLVNMELVIKPVSNG